MPAKKEPKKEIQIHSDDYRQIKCPVGPEILGYREPWEATEAFCSDCYWTYQYEPYVSKPIGGYKGKAQDRGCHCPSCKDRDRK